MMQRTMRRLRARRRRLSFDQLVDAVSAPRAARYLADAGSEAGAVRLYEQNVVLAADAWMVIADVEVVLRNVLADAIRSHHDSLRPGVLRWYDDPPWFPDPGNNKWLANETLKNIGVAMRRAKDPGPGAGTRPGEGRVIAELTLGFWKYLLIGRYEHSLWSPAIRASFPDLAHLSASQSRREVHRRIDELNFLRNRIAHHEPIHGALTPPNRKQPTTADQILTEATELVAWNNAATAAWITTRRQARR